MRTIKPNFSLAYVVLALAICGQSAEAERAAAVDAEGIDKALSVLSITDNTNPQEADRFVTVSGYHLSREEAYEFLITLPVLASGYVRPRLAAAL